MKRKSQNSNKFQVDDFVRIKIDKVDKTPMHPNVLLGKIFAIENKYAKVVTKFGIIKTLISPNRLEKIDKVKIELDTKKEITFTAACKMALGQ